MTEYTEKPDISEIYASATNAKNLRVEAEKRGQADILIAAGWSSSRVGGALLRLHSEWDACEHLKIISARSIESLALTLPRIDTGKPINNQVGCRETKKVSDITGAKVMAHDWYIHEAKIMLGKLKSLPEVRNQVEIQVAKWEVENPRHVAALVVYWWLDRTCKACDGRRRELVPGTNKLSAKWCRVCHGEVHSKPPFGEIGKRLAIWMDGCVERHRASLRSRLQNYRNV